MPKTLLDLLYEADAIQIDDVFVRHFHMEYEECEEVEDIVLHVEVEVDYNNYEWFFTLGELQTAVKYDKIDGYKVITNNRHTTDDAYQIIPYKLTELKA